MATKIVISVKKNHTPALAATSTQVPIKRAPSPINTSIQHFDCPYFTQIAHISDVHICPLKRHDEYAHVFSNLYHQLNLIKDGLLIVITGDLFDDKHNFKPETFRIARTFLKNLSTITHVCLIAGNHDMLENNLTRLDALSPIIDDIPNLTYFHLSGLYKPSNNNLLFVVSSLYDKTFITHNDIKTINPEFKKIALYHGSICSAVTDHEHTILNNQSTSSSRYRQITDFTGFDAVLLGDIHKYQKFTPHMCYAGSLIQQNHGESASGHGFVIWDKDLIPTHHEIKNNWIHATIQIKNGIITSNIDKFTAKKVYLRVIHDNTSRNVIDKLIEEFISSHSITVCKLDQYTVADNINTTEIPIELIKQEDDRVLIQHELIENPPQIVDKILELHSEFCTERKKEMSNEIWRPVWMEFSNLFGYHSGQIQRIDFSNGIIGIHGKNHTGKTSIANALMFGLFGKTPLNPSSRTYTVDIVHNKETSGYVKVLIHHGSKFYLIERKSTKKQTRSATTATLLTLLHAHTFSLEIYESDQVGNKIKNVAEKRKSSSDTFLAELIGNIDNFAETNLVSSGSTSILCKTNTDCLATLKSVFGLGVFDYYKKLNSDKLKIIDTKIADLQSKLSALKNINSSKKHVDTDLLLSQKTTIESTCSTLSIDIRNLEQQKIELLQQRAAIIATTSSLVPYQTLTRSLQDLTSELDSLTAIYPPHSNPNANISVIETLIGTNQEKLDSIRLTPMPSSKSKQQLLELISTTEPLAYTSKNLSEQEIRNLSSQTGILQNQIHNLQQAIKMLNPNVSTNELSLESLTQQLCDCKTKLSALTWYPPVESHETLLEQISSLEKTIHDKSTVYTTDQLSTLETQRARLLQAIENLQNNRDQTYAGTESISHFESLIKHIDNFIPPKKDVPITKTQANEQMSQTILKLAQFMCIPNNPQICIPTYKEALRNLNFRLNDESSFPSRESLLSILSQSTEPAHDQYQLLKFISNATANIEQLSDKLRVLKPTSSVSIDEGSIDGRISNYQQQLSELFKLPTTMSLDDALKQQDLCLKLLSDISNCIDLDLPTLLSKQQLLTTTISNLEAYSGYNDHGFTAKNISSLQSQVVPLKITQIPNKKQILSDQDYTAITDNIAVIQAQIDKLQQITDTNHIHNMLLQLKALKINKVSKTTAPTQNFSISLPLLNSIVDFLQASLDESPISVLFGDLQLQQEKIETHLSNTAHNTEADKISAIYENNQKLSQIINNLLYQQAATELRLVESSITKMNLNTQLQLIQTEISNHTHNTNTDLDKTRIQSEIDSLTYIRTKNQIKEYTSLVDSYNRDLQYLEAKSQSNIYTQNDALRAEIANKTSLITAQELYDTYQQLINTKTQLTEILYTFTVNSHIDELLLTKANNDLYTKIINQIKYQQSVAELNIIDSQLVQLKSYLSLVGLKDKYSQHLHNTKNDQIKISLDKQILEIQNNIDYIHKSRMISDLNNLQQQIDANNSILTACQHIDKLKVYKSQLEVHELNERKQLQISELQTDIERGYALIETQNNYNKILELTKHINTLKQNSDALAKIKNIDSSITKVTAEIDTLQSKLSVLQQQLSTVQDSLSVASSQNKQASDISSQIESLETSLSTLDETKQLHNLYKSLVDSKGIPFKLLEHKITVLQKDINELVSRFTKYNIIIIHDENKQTIDFITIDKDTKAHLSTARMSGYEKVMIEIAVKRALNRHSFNSKCSIMVIDEGFDVIDSTKFGLNSVSSELENFISALTENYTTCILISQRDTRHIVNHIIQIDLIDGVPIITQKPYMY